jgi:hypothetical protein
VRVRPDPIALGILEVREEAAGAGGLPRHEHLPAGMSATGMSNHATGPLLVFAMSISSVVIADCPQNRAVDAVPSPDRLSD